ncbi:MAG: hypothetical protein SFU91_09270 [Chloroherpetonaceae bacterium]|nr:hypothetical protein [Chloroherpetonaceae bacterium]
MKKNGILLLSALLIASLIFTESSSLYAQTSAGSSATTEARYLYNMPTAGVLKRGTYAIEGWAHSEGGTILLASVGLSNRFTFGISYGATNLIGSGNPKGNKYPGVMARYRLLDEEIAFPAITLGFESQGRGNWIGNRYERKAPGLFAVASKNFEMLGFITFHGGVSYSALEREDDASPNFFFGVEKTIGQEISIYGQFDAGLNDDTTPSFGNGRGFLDLGVRWFAGSGITIEVNFSNVLDNYKNIGAINRSIRLEYVGLF